LQLFPTLVILPCYDWDRIILVPKGHPLTKVAGPIDMQSLSAYPLITYVFSSTGESSFKRAFAEHGLEPQVVFTARDADIIKTYVRMGMGVGVVASMAFECADEKDLVPLDAVGLFPRVTTWLGFRRDSVLRGYMVDFISLLAPQLTTELVRKAAALQTQAEVDGLFEGIKLPLRSGCDQLQTAA
jgi:LysR family cys regulon transcriptional activator